MDLSITTHVDLPVDRLPGGAPLNPSSQADRKIVYFFSNYRYWILDYAETFINGKGITANHPAFINDAGYAFLALVNGYFDMIGQLCGSDGDQYDCYRQWDKNNRTFRTVKDSLNYNKNWAKWDYPPDSKDHKPQTVRCIWYGLTYVFNSYLEEKQWDPKSKRDWARFCYSFYYHTRNPVAHTTFPGELLVTRDNVPLWDFVQPQKRKVLAINLHLWYKEISEHFENYTSRIRFPQSKEERELRKRFLRRYKKLRK